eukprot:CAMPEP_0175104946 /NCGR_PEP_ID=MMETSP0086_2-20121207/10093_1 /TAXON_ID=136419 /ORGANISM="Unknown Unknown, Strain D1" /LENGTH=81 /DNA_ID=CAMNT_0016380561 /DNA_START=1 /DNA_END=243 /DNA_ORIENTATION=+
MQQKSPGSLLGSTATTESLSSTFASSLMSSTLFDSSASSFFSSPATKNAEQPDAAADQTLPPDSSSAPQLSVSESTDPGSG